MNNYIYPPNNMKNLFDMIEKVLLEEEELFLFNFFLYGFFYLFNLIIRAN